VSASRGAGGKPWGRRRRAGDPGLHARCRPRPSPGPGRRTTALSRARPQRRGLRGPRRTGWSRVRRRRRAASVSVLW